MLVRTQEHADVKEERENMGGKGELEKEADSDRQDGERRNHRDGQNKEKAQEEGTMKETSPRHCRVEGEVWSEAERCRRYEGARRIPGGMTFFQARDHLRSQIAPVLRKVGRRLEEKRGGESKARLGS
ncbi:hypothetical protein NDU88_001783 [Pleurodeles waltl]|uniref:Uncharacterized protein n=1 Tax=Pleurodeles waltl TaxID=8319 RepID=A0AAV7NBU6_PLEWA|nr:hypothetical protein NDU88_001783 [Pleurodeles waltl]